MEQGQKQGSRVTFPKQETNGSRKTSHFRSSDGGEPVGVKSDSTPSDRPHGRGQTPGTERRSSHASDHPPECGGPSWVLSQGPPPPTMSSSSIIKGAPEGPVSVTKPAHTRALLAERLTPPLPRRLCPHFTHRANSVVNWSPSLSPCHASLCVSITPPPLPSYPRGGLPVRAHATPQRPHLNSSRLRSHPNRATA